MNNSDPKKAKVSEIRFFQNASAFFDDKTSPSFQGVKLNTLIDTFEVDQKATVNVQGFPIVLRREQSIPGPLKDGVIFIEINGWPESMWVDKNGFYED